MESVGGGRARFMRPLTFSSPCRSMTARISSYTQIIHQIIKRESEREMGRGVTVEERGTEQCCTKKKIFEKLQRRHITKGRAGMNRMNRNIRVKIRSNNRQELVHLCFSGCQDKC